MSCARPRFCHAGRWLLLPGPPRILPCSLGLLQRDLSKKDLHFFRGWAVAPNLLDGAAPATIVRVIPLLLVGQDNTRRLGLDAHLAWYREETLGRAAFLGCERLAHTNNQQLVIHKKGDTYLQTSGCCWLSNCRQCAWARSWFLKVKMLS